MAKEVSIHITANNLTDSEYEKLIVALESVADEIKATSDVSIIAHVDNEKEVHQALKSKVSQ